MGKEDRTFFYVMAACVLLFTLITGSCSRDLAGEETKRMQACADVGGTWFSSSENFCIINGYVA